MADNSLALATDIALVPFRVDIGGIDKITAQRCEGIEDLDGAIVICGPAKDVAAKAEWIDIELGFIEEGHAPTVGQYGPLAKVFTEGI